MKEWKLCYTYNNNGIVDHEKVSKGTTFDDLITAEMLYIEKEGGAYALLSRTEDTSWEIEVDWNHGAELYYTSIYSIDWE